MRLLVLSLVPSVMDGDVPGLSREEGLELGVLFGCGIFGGNPFNFHLTQMLGFVSVDVDVEYRAGNVGGVKGNEERADGKVDAHLGER